MKLEIKKIGNSSGIILPKEVMIEMGWKLGTELFVVPSGDGAFRLTPYDPDFEASMRMVDDIMDEYKDTLKELAK
jgi:putative addiction module antidote